VDSIPTDGSKEDVVPMAMGAATKLRRILHNLRHVLGVELMCAAQGLESRRPLKSSAGVERGYAAVRARVGVLSIDRVLGPDIESLAEGVGAGEFA
jgi:histidine ammonia-lyase